MYSDGELRLTIVIEVRVICLVGEVYMSCRNGLSAVVNLNL